MHIAIIGAGLGGLCLAQGLRRRGISFGVYEGDAALDARPQGYRIKIDRTGQHALASCLDPAQYARFEACCALPVAATALCDPALEPLNGRWVDSWQRADGDDGQAGRVQDLNADRMRLRALLLEGIEPHVHFGKAFVDCDRGGARPRASFADGSSVECDVLVGADGANSAVRTVRFPGLAPFDTGSACIYGKTRLAARARERIPAALRTRTSVVFGDRLALIVDPMCFDRRWSRDAQDYMYWALIGPRERLEEGGPAGRPALAKASCHAGGWHPGLRALFELAEAFEAVMLPVRGMALPTAWQPQPLTLVGDAIHVMSPAGGLGANTALLDAATLAGRLAEAATGVPVLSAVAAYEQAMRVHAAEAIRRSDDGARLLFGGVEAVAR